MKHGRHRVVVSVARVVSDVAAAAVLPVLQRHRRRLINRGE